jgi:hypothetical protein
MLRHLALLTTLATLATPPSTASAQGWRGDRVLDLVNADVSFVTSAIVDGQRFRAIVLETRLDDPLLLLEVADPTGHRRRPWAQVRVASLDLGRVRVDTLNALDFRDIRFGRAALHFETTLRHGDVRCRIPLRRFDPRDRTVAAVCEDLLPPQPVYPGDNRPPAVTPPPHHAGPGRPPAVDPRPAVEAEIVARCGQAVIGGQAVEACIRAARPHGPQAPAVIGACGRAALSSDAIVGCLELTNPANPRNPELIGACANYTVGPTAWQSCLRTASASRYDPLPVLAQCHQATIGNEAFQRCLAATLR